MELDRNFVKQAQDALVSYLDNYDLSKDHVEPFFEQIDAMPEILGPLCSKCQNAEPNIDIVDNPAGEPWWYLINISCRCAKTCKEYTSYQKYFDKNGKKVNPGDKERYPGNITHKAGCVHFSETKAQ